MKKRADLIVIGAGIAGLVADVTGNNGTVHGAIASGLRAAKEIAESMS